ncbi:hypothetical protein [Tepidibacillus marianensis]|uniref:hypothetical protein n=1 Tax=Tepidibacillus marianensis TaxID=3131995 RepID=UPI0030CE15FA
MQPPWQMMNLLWKGYKKIESFLKTLQDIGVNWVTLLLPSLMEIASYVAPNLKIKASTLCQINSPTNQYRQEFYPYFASRCMALHLNPENYLKLNWIRPEDLHHYTDIGITHFNLHGRTNVYTGNPAKAVKHYIEEQYDGNLLNLLELFLRRNQ